MAERKLLWDIDAWNDYLYWQENDKKTLKRVNLLIKDICRSPYEGLGKPEALKENLSGFWSKRIDSENRIVYAVRDDCVTIIACRRHYAK